jgi:hypothetical protein
MIDMLKRQEIQVLRRAGHSLDEVAELAGVFLQPWTCLGLTLTSVVTMR